MISKVANIVKKVKSNQIKSFVSVLREPIISIGITEHGVLTVSNLVLFKAK